MDRPAKPPFSAGRVVKQSLMLDDSLKMLWLEHVALCGPEGAYIGATALGQRIGKSREAIERGRRELMRLGLLIAGARGRGQTGTYFHTLPRECLPSSDRPTVAEVARLAERLDTHIRRVRSGVTLDTPDAGRYRTGDATLASSAPPPSRENRAQSGVTGAPTNSQRLEEVGEVLQPEVGEIQNLQPEVGGPVLTDGERREQQRSPQPVSEEVQRLMARFEAKRTKR